MAGKRKNILIVAPTAPFPLNQSGNIRLWTLCQRLKSKYSFSLVSFVDSGVFDSPVDRTALEMKLASVFDHVVLVPQRTLPHDDLWFRFFDREVVNHPDMFLLGEKIQAFLRAVPQDLVHIEHVQMARCRDFVWDTPTTLTDLDIGWVKFFGSFSADSPKKSFWKKSARWARYFWRYHQTLRHFRGVVLTAPADMDWWQLWGPSDVPAVVVPTGVDIEHFAFSLERISARDRAELLFVGYYPHPGNASAVRFFLDEIWPLIRREVPQARVTFAGDLPPAWLMREVSSQIRVPGFVEDLPGLYRDTDVLVVPSQMGSGIKSKISEALSAGVPVVATPWAMTGFGPDAAKHIRVASSPKSFAQNVIQLLKNKDAQSEPLCKARKWVERHHGWSYCTALLDRFYRDVMAIR